MYNIANGGAVRVLRVVQPMKLSHYVCVIDLGYVPIETFILVFADFLLVIIISMISYARKVEVWDLPCEWVRHAVDRRNLHVLRCPGERHTSP